MIRKWNLKPKATPESLWRYFCLLFGNNHSLQLIATTFWFESSNNKTVHSSERKSSCTTTWPAVDDDDAFTVQWSLPAGLGCIYGCCLGAQEWAVNHPPAPASTAPWRLAGCWLDGFRKFPILILCPINITRCGVNVKNGSDMKQTNFGANHDRELYRVFVRYRCLSISSLLLARLRSRTYDERLSHARRWRLVFISIISRLHDNSRLSDIAIGITFRPKTK